MARNKTRGQVGKGSGSLNWVLVVVAVALLATVVLAVQHRNLARQQAQEVAAAATPPVQEKPEPVSDSLMSDLENIPGDVWTKVGTTDAMVPVFVGDSLKSDGKPVVLYIGAGYCPYCAAARWSVITSLSRFGKFSGLTLSSSSSVDVYPSTPTFSFYGSEYKSDYVELQSVELASSLLMANGHYQPLEKATPEQDALINKYDAPPYLDKAAAGGIPFILVGGRYMWSGSPFSPAALAHHSQRSIAATLPTGAGSAAELILANANQMTAAICAVDGNRPKEVCSDPMIQKAVKALPHKVP